MTDDKLQAIAEAGASGDWDTYWQLLDEQDATDWAPELMSRAIEVAERNDHVLERSADGTGDGARNMGGIRIKVRQSGRVVAGRRFELKPADVLSHFGVEL